MMRIEMIGTPIDHVLSPGVLNAMFRASGEPCEVVPRDVSPERLDGYVDRVRNDASMIGLLITTPLKQPIRAHLARETALVGFIGAANCIRFDAGRWIGANFDGYGFTAGLAEAFGPIDSRRILIVGCGGAGSAIAASLVESSDIELALCDIDRAKAAGLSERLSAFAPRSSVSVVPEPVGTFDIVINASPVGMEPGDGSPLPAETIAGAAFVADIVASETPLKRHVRDIGKPLLEGEAMVRGQAELFRRFLLGDAQSEASVLAP